MIALRIHSERGLDPGRIRVSHGVAPAKQIAPSNLPYAPQAYLPSSRWVAPTAEEERAWCTVPPNADPSECVAVVALPASVLEGFRAMGLADARSTMEFQRLVTSEECNAAIRHALDAMLTYTKQPDAIRVIGPNLNPPGLCSSTYDRHHGYYIGLHLDSWDRGPLLDRRECTNRICVNLGREDRFLMIVNQSVSELVEALGDGDVPPSDLPAKFLERHPRCPVVRLKIKPGEAYIAPTENCLHDGMGSPGVPDIQMTIRGHFSG